MWNGERTQLLQADKNLLCAAAENQDKYLPFREHQPSAKSMRSLFGRRYPDVMTTETGFRNVVITRFLSYNAPFLLSGAQRYFSTLEELLQAIDSEDSRGEEYFVSNSVYGRNVSRHTWNVRSVWESSHFPTSVGRSFKAFWSALSDGVGAEHSHKIRYIGPLLAMQIAGMLC